VSGAAAVLTLFLIEWTFGWAAAAAWNQSWGVVTRGHFRITAWIVAVLAILAVLANQAAEPADAGAQPGAVILMCVFAVLYLLAQYARSDIVGVVTGASLAAAGAVALVLSANVIEGWGLVPAAALLLSGGIFFGAVTNGMMLGHWYLNQPGLKPWALARLTDLGLIAVAVSGILGLISVGTLTDATTEGAILGLEGFGDDFGIAFFVIWFVLLLFSGAVVWAARRCVKIRSIQSATGLYYVAILTAGVGEFLVRYLMVNAA
jgi:hypothetical protein